MTQEDDIKSEILAWPDEVLAWDGRAWFQTLQEAFQHLQLMGYHKAKYMYRPKFYRLEHCWREECWTRWTYIPEYGG